MPSKMLIDSSHPEETRVVVVHGNRIEEFDFESQDKKQLKGNIYLARVTRVEPSLQAAFVEYGGNRHGFLAFSEIHPDYYQIPIADRQALLKADAEAAQSDSDDDEDERQDRKHGRNRRRRGRNRGRNGEDGVEATSARAEHDGEAGETDDRPVEASSDAEAVDGEVPVADSGAPATDAAANDGATDSGGEDDGDKPAPRSIAASTESDVVSEDVEAPASSGTVETVDGNGDDHEIESVGAEDAIEEAQARRRPVRRQYKIQEVIKRRQILLVQVVKEERGNKGAALTTYLSLAGRYSVLMPNTARGGGISRKITSAQDRKRLKEVVQDLDVPQGMGVILRTAGESRTKAEIKRDYEYLMRLWENVRTLTLQSTAPALVYEEGSLIKRSVRDLYNKDIGEILVAGDDGYREAKDFMRMLMPSHAKVVQPYRDTVPIFVRNGVEAQLDKMLQPQVTLKSGGYLIINQTEALVSIDVNSGRSTREHSIEETALHTNLEAAEEVARQLRLRDLAGLIVIDFIDMEENRNNRSVEKKLKECLKNDRARIQLGRISHFGLMEMSRQRIRASVLESTMKPCPHCGGTGHVRSDSSVALLVVRAIEEFLLKDARSHITVRTPASTAMYVLNHKRSTLTELEARFGLSVTFETDETVGSQHYAIMRGAAVEKPVTLPVLTPATHQGMPEPEEEVIEDEADDEIEAEAPERQDRPAASQARDEGDGRRKRRRRRRRGGRDRERENGAQGEASADAEADDAEDVDDAEAAEAVEGRVETDAEAGEGERRKRRRGKRGGRRVRGEDGAIPDDGSSSDEESEAVSSAAAEFTAPSKADEPATEVAAPTSDETEGEPAAAKPVRARASTRKKAEGAAKPTRRRAASRSAAPEGGEAPAAAEKAPAEAAPAPLATPPAPETAPAVVPANDDDRTGAVPSAEQVAQPAEQKRPEVIVTSPSADQPKRSGWWKRKSFF